MTKKPVTKPVDENIDEFHQKDIEQRMGSGDEIFEVETLEEGVIVDGEGVEVDDPNEEGGKRFEVRLPLGHRFQMSKERFDKYQERGVRLQRVEN